MGFKTSILSLRLEMAEQLGFVFFLNLYFHELSLHRWDRNALSCTVCVGACVPTCAGVHVHVKMGCFCVYVCTHDFLLGSCDSWSLQLRSPSSQRGLGSQPPVLGCGAGVERE